MSIDVLSIGEPLFEFNAGQAGLLEQVTAFETGFGGDTSNMLVAAARMGAKAAYISRVGDDAFGRQFLALWQAEGIDTQHVTTDAHHPTGIYFISRDAAGHHFAYYRHNSAASFLSPQDIPAQAVQASSVLHLSGITQAISTSACDAAFHAAELAKGGGTRITYDPNLRLKLWALSRARAVIMETIRQCDIVLCGLDEMQAVLNEDSPQHIISALVKAGAQTVVLKMGDRGVMYASDEGLRTATPLDVEVVDATGAGDTFDGAFCAALAQGKPIDACVQFANVAAALSVTKRGAVGAIPSLAEVQQRL